MYEVIGQIMDETVDVEGTGLRLVTSAQEN